ncbi:Fic family protein [Candidatus Woesearchaeota archaeon]|nr:Fic family protein [Candidatus Woesearchaeota archaeon]
MTHTTYRTTKLPEYYFKEIEAFVADSDKYVSVSEFLRSAVEQKLTAEKKRTSTQFLILKDIVFTKTRIEQIHDAVAKASKVDDSAILKKDFEIVIERSIDISLYRFLAKLMYRFMKFHPFVDGNKRTAFVAVDVFLRINDMKLSIDVVRGKKTQDEKFIWQASIQQKKQEDIERFLEKHTKNYLSSNDFDIELEKCLQENRQLLENLSE